jgi:glycosyltransferase involved in cell wall biosynthesis
MYRIGFVLEQALGHVTHAKNLMANVPADSEVTPYWGPVPWETRGLAARLPVYRSNWTVRAGLRTRALLREMAREVARDAASRDASGSRGKTGLDALFFHTQVPAILAAGWLKRVPGVVSLDATPMQYDQLGEFYDHAAGPAAFERYKWRLNRDCFRAARHLVTWANWTKRGLVADYGVPADKVTVIPPGVNTDEWRRPAPRVREDEPVKILFVGGNFERKGGKVLLDAFRRLSAEGERGDAPQVELHLVTRDAVPAGRGLFVYNDLNANSSRLKRLYHECDIFCLPTYGDSMPLVLSEAGAAGLPAVTTSVAAIPEVVSDGETGFIIPTGDAAALTAALRTLVCDRELRLRVGAAAVERVSREFDSPRNTVRLLDLLKQVARAGADERRVANRSEA